MDDAFNMLCFLCVLNKWSFRPGSVRFHFLSRPCVREVNRFPPILAYARITEDIFESAAGNIRRNTRVTYLAIGIERVVCDAPPQIRYGCGAHLGLRSSGSNYRSNDRDSPLTRSSISTTATPGLIQEPVGLNTLLFSEQIYTCAFKLRACDASRILAVTPFG